MLASLLSSRVRARILTALFLSPGVERNAWELAQSLGEHYSAVWKELNRLEGIGILVSEQKRNVKAYRVNNACMIEPELRSIVIKTEGVGGLLKTKLSTMENVRKAFIYGSVASGKADRYSDIDLMIIGEINLEELSSLVAEAEKELNRPINYVIFSEQEWKEKLANNEPYAVNVDSSQKIMLVGGEYAV
ncbi:MAG: nucleotidyltransferase domain-containing protein [Anaerolineaceae bacterium]|jgi:predicted nucleotidyltransferase